MIRQLLFFGAMGVALETLAILSYVGVARTSFSVPGKQIVAGIFLTAIIALLIVSARIFSLKHLVFLSTCFAVGVASLYQILGFALFSGMVKDIAFLSWDNLKIVGVLMLLILFCHMCGIFVIITLRNLMKNRAVSPSSKISPL
jgi:hypothetical protein